MVKPLIQYDKTTLRNILQKFDVARRSVFSTACAERLFPAYQVFFENVLPEKINVLRHALDLLWNDLEGQPCKNDQLEVLLRVVEELFPPDIEHDENWRKLPFYAAVYAFFAVLSTLYHRVDHNVENVVDVAEQAFEMIDSYLTIQDYADLNTTPGREEQLLNDPLMQTELFCQTRDLKDLLGSQEPLSFLAARIHVRAVKEAFCFAEAHDVKEIAWLREEARRQCQANQYLDAIIFLDDAVQTTREKRVLLISSHEDGSLKQQREQTCKTFVRLDESPLMCLFKDHSTPIRTRQLLLYALQYYQWKALSEPGAEAIVYEGKTYKGPLVDLLTHPRIRWLTKNYILLIINNGILRKEPDWVSYYFLERDEDTLQRQGIFPEIIHLPPTTMTRRHHFFQNRVE